jgi:hypothetical protein
LVWKDDAQVEKLDAALDRASDDPHTELIIYAVPSSVPYIKCEVCGKEFRTYPSWGARRKWANQSARKYCSRKCFGLAQRNGIDVPCGTCGKEIHRATRSIRRKQTVFFCSKECSDIYRTVALVCVHCGTSFRKPRSLTKTQKALCSVECSQNYWRAFRAKAARGTCSDCGGPTSKRSYVRCRSCRFRYEQQFGRGNSAVRYA